jgi:hypothetical protein
MSIKVNCPSCGAKRTLPEIYRDHSVTCPKCGVRFLANALESGSTESVAILTDAGAVSGRVEATEEPSTTLIVPSAQSLPPRLPDEPPSMLGTLTADTGRLRVDRSGVSQSGATPNSGSPTSAAAPTKREYKVLTRQNLWFSGNFDPKGFEEALNTFAKQGWTLKSTMVVTIPAVEGPTEEVVVILER